MSLNHTTIASLIAALGWACGASAQVENVWKFGPEPVAGELPATVGAGAKIDFYDGPTGYTATETKFGTAALFALPPIEGQSDVGVMSVPYLPGQSQAYRVLHQVGPTGSPTAQYVNSYTIVFDVLLPADSFAFPLSNWFSFYNTTCCNGNDGDAFTRMPDGGIGISGQYSATKVMAPDTWHRVSYAFDLCASPEPIMRKYIDGELADPQTLNSGCEGRWALYSNTDPEYQWFFLFSDNDGETTPVYTSAFGIVDRALTDAEVLGMGGVKAAGIEFPEASTCYPDCDADAALTIDDFICFQTFFALGDTYADCDLDTNLSIDDFICFQTFFAIGC